MLGAVAASQVVKTLTGVTTSNIRTDMEAVLATVERVKSNPTAAQRNETTIFRLDRNSEALSETLERTKGIGRGALLDIEA